MFRTYSQAWVVRVFLTAVCLAPLSTLLVGCSDDDGGASELAAADTFVGVYELTHYGENRDACEPPSESTHEMLQHQYLVAYEERILGRPSVTIASCSSPESCRAQAGSRDFSGDFIYRFDNESGEMLLGRTVTTGFSGGEVCEEGGYEELEASRDGETLILEQRGFYADYPSDDGLCDSVSATKAVEGQPCSAFLLLRAEFLETL